MATTLSMAASAANLTELYVIGDAGPVVNGTALGSWTIDSPVTVSASDGCFTINCTNLTTTSQLSISTVRTADPDAGKDIWQNWDGNRVCPPAALSNSNINLTLEIDPALHNLMTVPYAGDWRIVISLDLSTILVSPLTYTIKGDNIAVSVQSTKFSEEDGAFWLDIPEGTVTADVTWLNFVFGDWAMSWGPLALPVNQDGTAQAWQLSPTWVDGTRLSVGYHGTVMFIPGSPIAENAVAIFFPETVEHKQPVQPEADYYLVGDNIGWGAANEYKFSKTGDAYWLDITPEMSAFKGTLANLNIIKDGKWDAWWGLATKPIAANEETAWTWQANGSGNALDADQSYTGTIKLIPPVYAVAGSKATVTMYDTIIKHDISTSVSELADENAMPEYYTLEGIRVPNPTPGNIYIVRKGSKVTKTIIK